MLPCRVAGHRPRFRAEGPVMRWACERCGTGGEKRYGSAEEASRYAGAFDRSEGLGRRAPPFGLFPLRAWSWWRRRRAETGSIERS